MDALHRPRNFTPDLFAYAERKKIFEIFQTLLERISVDRPEKPVEYLYNLFVKKGVYDAPKVYLLGPPCIDRTLIATSLDLKLGLMHITYEGLVEGDAPKITTPADTANLVKKRLEKPDCVKRGWVLEGFPRTRNEAFCLRKVGIFPTHVALVEPFGLLDMGMEEATQEIQDYLTHKALILDFHKGSYVKEFIIESDTDVTDDKVLAFVRSKKLPPLPYLPRVLLFGPYGSGRKTVARKLATKYNLVEVNFQQELRKAAIKSSSVQERINKILQTSSPIPDEMTAEVASSRLREKDCFERGWVMYNFPETVQQAELLAKSLEGFQINRAVFLHASLLNCVKRAGERLVDPETGDMYHLSLKPPENTEIADRLIQLPQDSPETIEAEYRLFEQNVQQLQEFFKQNFPDDITVDVDADLSEVDTFEGVQGAVLKSAKMKLAK